jgi:hypothetical protein
MTDGKFATRTDVTGRFEGTIPSNRLDWVDLRIGDVESELMYQVPSLRKALVDIEADNALYNDTDRLSRVRNMVAVKVLDLFRNPAGPQTQKSTTTPDITMTDSYSPDPTRGKVQFTQSELSKVRIRTPKKRFGSIQIDPGIVTHDRPWLGIR